MTLLLRPYWGVSAVSSAAPPSNPAGLSAQQAIHDPSEWIRSERLLCKEGSVYGLAGEGLEEKQLGVEC